MRGNQCDSRRTLINLAALETDKSVFEHVDPPYSMFSRLTVQFINKRRAVHTNAVQSDRNSLLEQNLHIFRLIRGFMRLAGQCVGVGRRFVPRILQNSAFDGAPPDIVVDAVRGGMGRLNGDAVSLRILHLGFAGEVPVPDRGKHREIRIKRVGAHFDAHLILSFACAAVGDRDGAFFFCDLRHNLGNKRARERGVQRIDALIHPVGLQ